MYTTFRNLYLFLLRKIRNYTIGIIRDFNFFRETPFEEYQKESLEKSYNHFKKYLNLICNLIINKTYYFMKYY